MRFRSRSRQLKNKLPDRLKNGGRLWTWNLGPNFLECSRRRRKLKNKKGEAGDGPRHK